MLHNGMQCWQSLVVNEKHAHRVDVYARTEGRREHAQAAWKVTAQGIEASHALLP